MKNGKNCLNDGNKLSLQDFLYLLTQMSFEYKYITFRRIHKPINTYVPLRDDLYHRYWTLRYYLCFAIWYLFNVRTS